MLKRSNSDFVLVAMASIISIRAVSVGSVKCLLNKLVGIPNLEEITSRSLIRDNIVEKNEDILFDAHTRSVKDGDRGVASILSNNGHCSFCTKSGCNQKEERCTAT